VIPDAVRLRLSKQRVPPGWSDHFEQFPEPIGILGEALAGLSQKIWVSVVCPIADRSRRLYAAISTSCSPSNSMRVVGVAAAVFNDLYSTRANKLAQL